MTETQFIENNKEDWKALELLLEQKKKDPDELNRLFVKVSSDLAYARTFFPNRAVRVYLNGLTMNVVDSMRRTRRFSFLKDIKVFFTQKLPYEIYNSRQSFYLSFIVFALSVTIGMVSSAFDENFPRLILGDDYINMTEDNIAKGDPMAVYKDERKADMFFFISSNNIRVSFFAFILGITGTLGTLMVLISNGIMVGAFQYFFISKGLFKVSFLTIWIHGTIEISAIIIAGAAGIIMGKGLLFPKGYSRMVALQSSTLRALRIIFGTIPLFFLAAILESYVTRQTHFPDSIRIMIIVISFLFICLQWIFHPWYYMKTGQNNKVSFEIAPRIPEKINVNKLKFRSFGEIFTLSTSQLRKLFLINFRSALFFFIIPVALILWLVLTLNYTEKIDYFNLSLISYEAENSAFIITLFIASTIILLAFRYIYDNEKLDADFLLEIKNKSLFLFAVLVMPFYFATSFQFVYLLIYFLVIPPQFIINVLESSKEQFVNLKLIKESYALAFKYWGSFFLYHIISGLIIMLFVMILGMSISRYIISIINWHSIFDERVFDSLFVNAIIYLVLGSIITPFIYSLYGNKYYSLQCQILGTDLEEGIANFGLNQQRT